MKLKPSKKYDPTKPQSLLVNFVLDESSSMSSIRDSVITGFNEFKATQAKEGETFFSLSFFNTESRIGYTNQSADAAPDLSIETYRPNGLTALVDATKDAIDALATNLKELKKSKRPNKILFVIYTDGGENSSRRTTTQELSELIESKRKKDDWEFVFLGADQDAWNNARQFGVKSQAHTLSFDRSNAGVDLSFNTLGSATTSYRGASTRTVADYFVETDLRSTKLSESQENT